MKQLQNFTLILVLILLGNFVTRAEVVNKDAGLIKSPIICMDRDSFPTDTSAIARDIEYLIQLRKELTEARHDALLARAKEKKTAGTVSYLEECLFSKQDFVDLEKQDLSFDTLELVKDDIRDLRVYVKRARKKHRWATKAAEEATAREAELEDMVIDLETHLLAQGVELPSKPTDKWKAKQRFVAQRLEKKRTMNESPKPAYAPLHPPSGLYLLKKQAPLEEENQKRKEHALMASETLFHKKYTSDRGDMYLYATGELKQVEDLYFFDLEIYMDSRTTANIYGKIERGSVMRVALENGEMLSLVNLISQEGRTIPVSGEHVFEGRYLIEKSELERLESVPMEKIRLYWTGGYEDYQITTMDFFILQLALLNR